MSFRIERTDDLIEVYLWGHVQGSEIMSILWQLNAIAPRKEISDVWLLAEDCVVPWDTFLPVVKELGRLLSPDMKASRSAIVVASHLQMAQAQLYLEEAKRLPFETRAFLSREEAVTWLKG
jgi:hypothetical protein